MWAATVVTMLALQACAPEPPPEPKPSDGFLLPADRAFVEAAWAKVAGTYKEPGTAQYGALTISEDAGGRTLCGESAEPDQLPRGFVATQETGKTAFEIIRERDNISPRAVKACKPLIRKHMGQKSVDTPEIQQAIVQNGCANIDTVYWRAHKDRCYKTLTVAGGVATPAPPP
ncbi:hypothetical protein ASD21_06715 [Caulobacter sp. Root1455]|uniref:hypothetical protein n=1 Tax=Caulobacter sp. Root1455 TaxID=1736465 RepID=UPI0007005454|nr:hypothetical protein [Caulobacter sp. Root1455]KQY96185.1 hypothetical protein ASD21_06715 [Caulobacter sp. Root1455]